MTQFALGRNTPPDWRHVEKFPFDLEQHAQTQPYPVSPGVNWYTSFDNPIELADGTFRLPDVGKGETLGEVRGGHCFCLEPASGPYVDNAEWWKIFNQGPEGACEGFGHGRAISLVERRPVDCFWIYDDARRFEGTFPEGEGSTNRAALGALQRWGCHWEADPELREPWHPKAPGPWPLVKVYRWITTASVALQVLGETAGTGATILNSWGEGYPHRVRIPAATLDRLLQEEGECDTITER